MEAGIRTAALLPHFLHRTFLDIIPHGPNHGVKEFSTTFNVCSEGP